MGRNHGSSSGLGRKLLWFAVLWIAGVVTIGAVAYGIRFFLVP